MHVVGRRMGGGHKLLAECLIRRKWSEWLTISRRLRRPDEGVMLSSPGLAVVEVAVVAVHDDLAACSILFV